MTVVPFSSTMPAPSLGTPGAAAYDLTANDSAILVAGQTACIGTGLSVAIPKGMAGLVCSRSGLALKHGVFVLNAPGVIDSDYRGEIGVILHKAAGSVGAFTINAGDRIAQLMFVRCEEVNFAPVDFQELGNTERGTGGFGSTGVA